MGEFEDTFGCAWTRDDLEGIDELLVRAMLYRRTLLPYDEFRSGNM